METLIFDIEGNGLNEVIINSKGNAIPEADRIWCAAVYSMDDGTTTGYTEMEIFDLVDRLNKAKLIIGHNICCYDIPLLCRLYKYGGVGDANTIIDTPTYDTLIVSRLMWPDKPQLPNRSHSLKSWGEFLNCPKSEYTGGFDEYTDEMLEYCKQDTVVAAKIYEYQKEFAAKNESSIRMEHKVAKIISHQVENGFGFDVDAATQLEKDMLLLKVSIEDHMQQIFPDIIEERWSDKTGKRLKDKIIIFNPGSRKQIASRLKDKYGWKAPMTEKKNPKVDRSILSKLNYPEAKLLVTYFDNNKLMSQISDWITRAESSRDGKIHGSIITLGTVTGRMTSNNPNMQQVSGDKRARSLFKPRKGWVLVGADLSGLELRMLAHYMAKYDGGSYANQILNGDIHIHNQKAMGLDTRSNAKSAIYCFLYGGGDKKFGSVIGVDASRAKRIKQELLANIPGLKRVLDDCRFYAASSGSIKPFGWREIPVRYEHAALNTLLQSSGAHIAKVWTCYVHDKLTKLFPNQWAWIANVHDELQIECSPDIADELGRAVCDCAKDAGKFFNCNLPIEAEYTIGKDWSETH